MADTTDTIKLFRNIDIDGDILFKNKRQTQAGTWLIDITCDYTFQTTWLPVKDVGFSIVTDATIIRDELTKIDEKVIDHCSQKLGMSIDEITKTYRHLCKETTDGSYFYISPTVNTVLYDSNKNAYGKSDIKQMLSQNDFVRLLFKFKKLNFKNYSLTFSLELLQIEKM